MSLFDARHHIRSIKNISHMTKAVETVAASKMRRSQALALAGRPYALSALNILKNILAHTSETPFLLQKRSAHKTVLAVIASDAGFAGSLNTNVFRTATQWLDAHSNSPTELITVGKKAHTFARSNGKTTVRSFSGFGDYLVPVHTMPFAAFLLDGYRGGSWDRVVICYTNFRTALIQETKIIEVLPFHIAEIETAIREITPEYGRYALKTQSSTALKFNYEYTFEPSPTEVLEALLPELFKIHIHHILLESNASEHSARMVAMKRASENAEEILHDCTAQYHILRQAAITRELTEIIAGAEALKNI